MANKVTQLRDLMWADAFSDYIMTDDWQAHTITLLAWIDDINLWGSLWDVVDEANLVTIEANIANAPEAPSTFPKPHLKTSYIRIRRNKISTVRLYWAYLTPDTEIIVEWCELLNYRFDYEHKIYLKVRWWNIKWKFNITFINTWWETNLIGFINVR